MHFQVTIHHDVCPLQFAKIVSFFNLLSVPATFIKLSRNLYAILDITLIARNVDDIYLDDQKP